MKKGIEKTNVMRTLDQKKIKYESHCYADTDAISGIEVAEALSQNPNQVFKTLVTESPSKNHYVFLVPVHKELDLKKAARACERKSIELIPLKKLLPLTGYVHGGCSPLGMKKLFPTFIDETAQLFDRIWVSGGRVGLNMSVAPEALAQVVNAKFADIAK